MSRRAQVGLLSLLLTAFWGAAFVAAFVGGSIGQHPSPQAALTVMVAFCAVLGGLLLTLASFPDLAESLRPLGQVAAAGATLIAIVVGWSALPAYGRVPPLFEQFGFSNFLLLPSMLALLASSVLWIARLFSGRASRSRFQPMGAVQSVFLLLRRQHRILGWLALAFAAMHSMYYLIIPGDNFVQWTGIAATALLAVLGLLGLITDYNTRVRLWTHRILAIAMIAALVLHWPAFLPASIAILVVLWVVSFLHLKLVAGLAYSTGIVATLLSRQFVRRSNRGS